MNYILLTQKINNELKDKYTNYIMETSSKIDFVSYISEIFNPSNRGIIYTKISEEPLKIKIWSQDLEMVLEEVREGGAFKSVAIKNINIERFNKILRHGDYLQGGWKFELISSEISYGGEFEYLREKECFNEKQKEFEEYNKYWIDSDIITKKREEKSKDDAKKSITEYVNIGINFDKSTVIFKLKENKYKFKESQRIRISSKLIKEPSIQSSMLVGNVIKYSLKEKELIVESNDIRLLEELSQNKEYKNGCLFIDDIGTMIMLKRQKDALKSLFNRNTANENLKDFLPNISEASKIRLDFLDETLLSDEFKNMNESQKKSIKNAIECKDISLIQGPPGTGKTTVICEIVKYLTKDNKNVLISSQNHLAVDNVLQRIGDEDSVRAIRVGNEENFELGCEKYALSDRVKFLQEEIISNIQALNYDLEKHEQFINDNKEMYNYYINGKQKVKSLLNLVDNYQIHINMKESLNKELDKVNENLLEVNSKVLEVEAIVGDKLKDIEKLSQMLNDSNYNRENIIRNSSKILNLKVEKDVIESISLYSKIKDVISTLLQEYKEIELLIKKEIDEQKELRFLFDNTKNKATSLIMQKSQLSESVQIHLDTKVEELKEELVFIKEDYRRKSSDIKTLENKRTDIYNKIVEYKEIIDEHKEKIEVAIKSNLHTNIKKDEFIQLINMKKYLYEKGEECGVDINLISYINKLEKFNSIIREKSKLEDNIQLILKDITKEKNYINAFRRRIDQQILDENVKNILENENVDFASISSETIENIESYIDRYNERYTKKDLLDKTSKLREEWKESISYYQQSFEDLYIGISNVICATCSGIASSNHNNFSEMEFDYVIVDEAAKCFSSEILIPIIKGKKIVLVGDHKQLSPIVEKNILKEMEDNKDISRDELNDYLNNSLFGIMFEKANSSIKTTLDIQYRMNSDISAFVSKQYYDNKLKNGPNIINLNHGVPKLNRGVYWIDTEDIENSREDVLGTSYYNKEESNVIVNLLNWLEVNLNSKKEIGIISPYRAQKNYLIDLLEDKNFNNIDLEINTVDAFQGREKEIIIMNCVRNNEKGEFGHVSGNSRMNVAISRAQELLFVVGSRDFIEKYKGPSRSIYSLVNYLGNSNSIIKKDFFS